MEVDWRTIIVQLRMEIDWKYFCCCEESSLRICPHITSVAGGRVKGDHLMTTEEEMGTIGLMLYVDNPYLVIDNNV